MGGRASKQKGNRNEYLARDYFRSLGMLADRVPSSGAAQGFPGDIKVISKDGTSFLVEVKSRTSEFKSVYANFAGKGTTQLRANNEICIIAETYDGLYTKDSMDNVSFTGALPRGIQKIFTMQKWVKGSDILMIKDNNKPFIFIRYLK